MSDRWDSGEYREKVDRAVAQIAGWTLRNWTWYDGDQDTRYLAVEDLSMPGYRKFEPSNDWLQAIDAAAEIADRRRIRFTLTRHYRQWIAAFAVPGRGEAASQHTTMARAICESILRLGEHRSPESLFRRPATDS
jgi:hypothetical protein